jgi:hypothetical protein
VLGIVLVLSVAVRADASHLPVIHLEGPAQYKAVGHCFALQGAIPVDAKMPARFKIRTKRERGTVQATFDYDMNNGDCTLVFSQPERFAEDVFQGVCAQHPPGDPLPLAPVEDPRHNLDLLPVILFEPLGFGGMNGYLVFPAGGLEGGGEPLGFSTRFMYTTTFVPPSAAVWRSRWVLGRRGPTSFRCVYRGTFRLGQVPVY